MHNYTVESAYNERTYNEFPNMPLHAQINSRIIRSFIHPFLVWRNIFYLVSTCKRRILRDCAWQGMAYDICAQLRRQRTLKQTK